MAVDERRSDDHGGRADDDDGGGAAALVLPLEEACVRQRAQVGGKAAALGEMLSAGLPVPDGFCITTEAFRRFLSAADAEAEVAALDGGPAGDAERLAALGAAVRLRLAAAPMPVDLAELIVSAWRGPLSGVACAVRSSATAEDLDDATFAGQQDTVLNVRGAEALLRAVRQCWSSLFSDRAVAYRARRGLGHGGVHMAVVVQAFVPAEAAGVLFTVNPLSGRPDEVLIEASVGLGEAVVSGRVTPDRFIVGKDVRRILHRTVSHKAHAVVPAPDGGVIEQPLAAPAAQAAALSDDAARQLTELGAAAERLFGAPQDVEWAIRGGDLFVLQSRPITTVPHQPADDDRQVWTNMNTGEILPDVVSPLTWSFIERSLLQCFLDVFTWLGFDLDDSPLMGRIAGRLYFNLNTAMAITRAISVGNRIDVTAMFGGLHADSEGRRGLAVAERNRAGVKLLRRGLVRRLPRVVLWWLYHLVTTPERRLGVFVGRVEERRRQDLSALSESSLVEELHRGVDVFKNGIVTLGGYVLMGAGAFFELHTMCARRLPNESDAANQLLTGVGGMASAEAGLDMWRLAALAHANTPLAWTLLAGDGFAATRIAVADVDGGVDFLARWDEFMVRHGHHARGEIELMNRRWAEDPDYVLGQVRSYLSGMGGKDPVASHRAQGAESRRRAAELRRRLGRLQRVLFDFRLRRARRGVVWRENVKSEAVRLMAFIRQVALALGERLVARGALAQPDDIFHLHLDELAARPGQAPVADLRGLVIRRRAELERYRSIVPPAVVVGRFDASALGAEVVDAATDRLCGVGVSPGLVTGRARVILRADADERVQSGEILVTPFTDPGWTPYFQLAAGLVTDLGGLLSHGSIVAREYGLPAVVNVGSATRLIQTGDWLQLDGTHGEVRILRRLGSLPHTVERPTTDFTDSRITRISDPNRKLRYP